ncbi:MAG TPA: RNA methyltransferase [Nitrospirota bacterium]|nr:RNA methyltransferase [Nitrospirota bacterium]
MQQNSPHNPLTGKDNATIRRLRSLQQHKFRKKEKTFLIEGVKMVEEALRDDAGVTMVVAAPSLVQHHGRGLIKLAERRQVDIVWIAENLMQSVSESITPQPVLAVVRMRNHLEESLLGGAAGLIVVAYQLQDPGNLGTIIRTVEAAGASGLAVTPNTVDPYNAKTIRASMGSILRVPVVLVQDMAGFVQSCRRKGFQTAATVLAGGRTHFETDLRKPTVVIVGQEGAGLPKDMMADIDLHIRIPMTETIDSLNVATAAAVILYEAVRQRSHADTQ